MINWMSVQTALALHTSQIKTHGGGTGLRDQALLESALARPQNKHVYEGQSKAADIAVLAAAYAYGIARNHCFVDGNKRTALMISFVFVERNFFQVTANEEDAYRVFLDLAAGDVSEDELVVWFRANIKPADHT